MAEKLLWLALRYSVPAEPSRSRVYVWRHLRQLGAQSTAPGLAVLPDREENATAFEALAGDVRRFGGEALLIRFSFLEQADEDKLQKRFAAAAEREEQTLLRRFTELTDQLKKRPGKPSASILRELKRSVRRLEQVAPPVRETPKSELRAAADEIREALRSLPAEIHALLRGEPEEKRKDD